MAAFCQIHTTTASHPLPHDRHKTTFSVIVGPSNPSKRLFRGTFRLEGGGQSEDVDAIDRRQAGWMQCLSERIVLGQYLRMNRMRSNLRLKR
jgi:hypothetical protein